MGGLQYGLAKKTELITVKVLGDDGSGTSSDIIAGLQWINDDLNSRKQSSQFVKGTKTLVGVGWGCIY